MNRSLRDSYRILYRFFGPQYWWPGDTRLEIIIGAILTQNTAWTNVEKAIANLKSCGALASVEAMTGLPEQKLSSLIRSAGYHNIKAGRIRNFLSLLSSKYGNSLRGLARLETGTLRGELLSVSGIGPETADSILLYAFDRPVFVVDAYTKRIFSRHGLFKETATYEEIQSLFTRNLPGDRIMFNEYHALIVRLGKEHCRTKPNCRRCPLFGLKIACKRH